MSKAEDLLDKATERALEKYPYAELCREKYIEGYHQADKDLELSWVDIKIILDIEIDILRECGGQMELVLNTYPKGEDYYGEILKRYKELKK